MGKAAEYALEVWATVIFVSPILFFAGELKFYLFTIFYGLMWSLPALLVFTVLVYFISKTKLRVILKKIILALIGVLFMYITFRAVAMILIEQVLMIYGFVLLAAIFIFKLEPPEKPKEDIGN